MHSIGAAAVSEHHALQKPEELAALLDVLAAEAPQVVVEIGSDAGGTLWAWQQLPSAPRVIGVSLYVGPFATLRELDTSADVLVEDSHDRATREHLESWLGGDPVDALFLDGDHTYEGVRRDWVMYEPLVRAGGIVALHDICHHASQPDVQVDRMWEQIPEPKHEIIAEPSTWGGIGWYRKGDLA